MRSPNIVLVVLACSLLFKEHYFLSKFSVVKRIAKKNMYIENRIGGKAAGASPVGVEADELLRAATLWSGSVLQGESEKKSQLSRKRGIGCRRKDGSIREA